MKKLTPAAVLGILVFIAITIFALWNPLQVVQWKLSDLFFRAQPVSDDITIIAIDDKSLSKEANLGRFKDWPRSYYAQLLRTLSPHQPAVIAFDLDFHEASRGMSDLRIKQLLEAYDKRAAVGTGSTLDWYSLIKRFDTTSAAPAGGAEATSITHPDDTEFQDAIKQTSAVVLASNLLFAGQVDETSDTVPAVSSVVGPIFSGDNIHTGYINVFHDRDGVVRHFIPVVGSTLSFPLAIAAAFSKNINPTQLPQGVQTRIAYYGTPYSYRTLSFVDVLAGNYKESDIKGKIIMVGGTAPILQDMAATPTSRAAMPGVEVNATMVQQLLEDRGVSDQGTFSLIILLAVVAVGGTVLFFSLSLRAVVGVAAGFFLFIPAAAFAFYQRGFVMNVVYPELALIASVVVALWYRSKTEFKEKKMIKNAFAHYVSPVVVNQLANDPSMLRLGGTRKEISVMFSDIVGFTTLAEKLSPEDTVALLNDYLTAMTEVIFGYQGTLDKYQGDAIMALFGAPLTDEHHAVNACLAALNMRKALVGLHEKWHALPEFPFKDELVQLDFRVGIASGPAIVGNVGSERRFDYTAIGDIVNLGSRLESINRKYGTRVIVDKTTFTIITNNHNPFIFRKLDVVRVKGKKQSTEIFEVVGLAETITTEMKSMLDDFENGRLLYTQRNFIEAKQYFEAALTRLPDDAPCQIYLNRCKFFIRKPPSVDWDSTVNLEEK